MADDRKGRMAVYVINERTTPDGPRSFWTRVGVAFTNRDGSITCKLDALPLSGTLQIRDEGERDARKGAAAAPVNKDDIPF